MNSKKAITLLVLATLVLSIIPITISFASIDNVEVKVDGTDIDSVDVYYGDTLVITGDGVTAGKYIRAYWDAVQSWDGEAGLLNSTKASSDSSFELWIDVPSATNGNHYIWLEDAQTGETYMFDDPAHVEAKVEVSPSTGLEDDVITLYGYGFGEEVDLAYITISSNTTAIANETLVTSMPETDTLGYWTTPFKVPKFDDGYVYADYNITCEDTDGILANGTFTIGPSVTINKESGPTGTVVRASGRGFEDDGEILYVQIFNTDGLVSNCTVLDEDDLDINGKGQFTLDLVIPLVPDVDDDYYLNFTDDAAHEGVVDFEVTGLPEIEVTPEYGAVGSTVTVAGYNFTQVSGETVTLTLNGIGDT